MRLSRQFSFLYGPNKLVFVRMYGSTFTGLVGHPYPYYSLAPFCAFLCFFVLYCMHKNTHKKKLTNNNKKTNTKQQIFCAYKLLRR